MRAFLNGLAASFNGTADLKKIVKYIVKMSVITVINKYRFMVKILLSNR